MVAFSALLPLLSPVILRFEESEYTPESGKYFQPPLTIEVLLTDDKMHYNLGLKTAVWKRYSTVLASEVGKVRRGICWRGKQ